MAIIVGIVILFFIIAMIIGEVCLKHMIDNNEEVKKEKHE
jgi:hypothetical protein